MSEPVQRRVRIVPRWGGGPERDFYPWLTRAAEDLPGRPLGDVVALSMPAPDCPTIEGWVGRLNEALGADPAFAAGTLLVGHSVGCQAVLRYLAALPPGVRYAGVLLVAGWLWVDKPWETIRPWLDTPLDLAAARRATSKLVVLLSTDDPFTADHEANRRAWEERGGAEVVVVNGGKHFNAAEEPAVLDALQKLL